MLKHSLAELLDTIADLLEVASGVKTEQKKASSVKCYGENNAFKTADGGLLLSQKLQSQTDLFSSRQSCFNSAFNGAILSAGQFRDPAVGNGYCCCSIGL